MTMSLWVTICGLIIFIISLINGAKAEQKENHYEVIKYNSDQNFGVLLIFLGLLHM